jgi:hypothetical protein
VDNVYISYDVYDISGTPSVADKVLLGNKELLSLWICLVTITT